MPKATAPTSLPKRLRKPHQEEALQDAQFLITKAAAEALGLETVPKHRRALAAAVARLHEAALLAERMPHTPWSWEQARAYRTLWEALPPAPTKKELKASAIAA